MLKMRSVMWVSVRFMGLVSGRSRLNILEMCICRSMGELELVDSAMIW